MNILIKSFLILIVFIQLFTISLNGQNNNDSLSENSIYIDASNLIITGSYSINYEKVIYHADNLVSNVNVGFGRWYLLTHEHPETATTIPLSLNLLLGNKKFVEVDIGYRIIFVDNPNTFKKVDKYAILNIGYRYQNFKSDLLFRAYIGITGVGLSIGKCF